MATTLLHAGHGGTAADNDGRVRLHVPPGALDVDTRITIVAEPTARAERVFGRWLIVAHPGPAALTRAATLSIAVPKRTAPGSLQVIIDGEAATAVVALDSASLNVITWHVPPSAGAPPTQSSAQISLVQAA